MRRRYWIFRALAILALFSPAAPLAAQEGVDGVATGLGNRFINLNTPLTNDPGVFEAVITHRFSQAVKDGGSSSFFGLDGSAQIGLGLEYVPLKNVAVQVYRARNFADYEFATKVTLLRPTADLPIAVGVRGGLNWLTAPYLPSFGVKKSSSGFGQVLVSGTLFDRVTLAVAPSYVQRTPFQTDVWKVPVMAQLKITKSIALIAEFIPKSTADLKSLSAFDPVTGAPVFVDLAPVYQWSVMLEKRVFHHRFALTIGNTLASSIDQMMGGDYGGGFFVVPGSSGLVPYVDANGNKVLVGGVTDKNIRLGFNVIREFDFK